MNLIFRTFAHNNLHMLKETNSEMQMCGEEKTFVSFCEFVGKMVEKMLEQTSAVARDTEELIVSSEMHVKCVLYM